MSFPHPIVARAYVTDSARAVVAIELDEDIASGNATGLSLDFLAGTPRTITGLSFSGRTAFAALDGPISFGDWLVLEVGANTTITGVDGSRLSLGAVTVKNMVTIGGPPPSVPVPDAIVRVANGGPAITIGRGQRILVNVSGGPPPPMTTEAEPDDGAPITVINAGGSFATTACVVSAHAGQTIEDPATPGTFGSSASLAIASMSVTWMYDAQNARWKVV